MATIILTTGSKQKRFFSLGAAESWKTMMTTAGWTCGEVLTHTQGGYKVKATKKEQA
jgi:hypothetical protein